MLIARDFRILTKYSRFLGLHAPNFYMKKKLKYFKMPCMKPIIENLGAGKFIMIGNTILFMILLISLRKLR